MSSGFHFIAPIVATAARAGAVPPGFNLTASMGVTMPGISGFDTNSAPSARREICDFESPGDNGILWNDANIDLPMRVN